MRCAVCCLGFLTWLCFASIAKEQPAPPEHNQANRTEQPPPAARYSPLAARGGYKRQGMTWYDAAFRSLNPSDFNWGAWWEQRRRVWLENVALNPYFWYSFVVTSLLMMSGFALAVQHSDRLKERRRWAEVAADAKHYADYCKRQALEAAERYNAHVEKCNRVIESADSGLVTPETANITDLRSELERLRADNDAKTRQVQKLDEQLKEREAATSNLMVRIAELEKTMGSKRSGQAKTETAVVGAPNAALIERINRLERELASRNEQLRRLQGG